MKVKRKMKFSFYFSHLFCIFAPKQELKTKNYGEEKGRKTFFQTRDY